MANATNTLQATIISTDQNGNIPINRGMGNPQLAGNVGEFTLNQNLANGDNVITLPAANIFQLYVKNNAANGSGLKIVVKYSVNGGAQQIGPAIEPGGVQVPVWNTINTDNAGSLTALTLNASAANIPVEYFIGA